MNSISNNRLWVAVNKDSTIVVFNDKPTKTKIYEKVESETEVEFTPYGDVPKLVDGEKYVECWVTTNCNGDLILGTPINHRFLSDCILERTWDDDPVFIS